MDDFCPEKKEDSKNRTKEDRQSCDGSGPLERLLEDVKISLGSLTVRVTNMMMILIVFLLLQVNYSTLYSLSEIYLSLY